eukprot:1876090-Rhodomonas_salina.1
MKETESKGTNGERHSVANILSALSLLPSPWLSLSPPPRTDAVPVRPGRAGRRRHLGPPPPLRWVRSLPPSLPPSFLASLGASLARSPT